MPTIRLNVKVTVYDADMQEHTLGPIPVEIEEPAGPFDHPGDHWMACEKAAADYLTPDLHCDLIYP